MAELQVLLNQIDTLFPDELERIYRHVVQRCHPAYWLIPGERLKEIQESMQPVYEQTAGMSDEEINAIIDESLKEVRRR